MHKKAVRAHTISFSQRQKLPEKIYLPYTVETSDKLKQRSTYQYFVALIKIFRNDNLIKVMTVSVSVSVKVIILTLTAAANI